MNRFVIAVRLSAVAAVMVTVGAGCGPKRPATSEPSPGATVGASAASALPSSAADTSSPQAQQYRQQMQQNPKANPYSR